MRKRSTPHDPVLGHEHKARVHTADRNRRHGKRSLCAIAEGIRKRGSDLIERRHRALTARLRCVATYSTLVSVWLTASMSATAFAPSTLR